MCKATITGLIADLNELLSDFIRGQENAMAIFMGGFRNDLTRTGMACGEANCKLPTTKNAVLWNVTPYGSCKYRRFVHSHKNF
jgi:hypothetical protein